MCSMNFTCAKHKFHISPQEKYFTATLRVAQPLPKMDCRKSYFALCISFLPCCQADEQLFAVGLILCLVRGAVTAQFSAHGASVDDHKSSACIGLYADRFHLPAALVGAIPRVDVHMQRPQAKGAMIARGIAQRNYFLSAMRANKTVVVFRKSLLFHVSTPRFSVTTYYVSTKIEKSQCKNLQNS